VARDYNSRNGVEASEGVITVTEGNTRITVTNSRNVDFFLARVLGISNGGVEASSSAKVWVANGFQFDDVDVFPFAVWAGNPGQVISKGQTVTFMSNKYEQVNVSSGNANWDVPGGNNSFKGFFKHGGEIVYTGTHYSTTFSPGTACGQQPIAALNEKKANGDFIVLPVIDYITGNGHNITVRIIAFAAVVPTVVDCP
jgi:hypothetical protein